MKYLVDIELFELPMPYRANLISKVHEFIEHPDDIYEVLWEFRVKRNAEGQMVMFVRVPFFEAPKRDEFKELIEAEVLLEIWDVCEVGSYLAVHNCDHDQPERHGCAVNKFMEKI